MPDLAFYSESFAMMREVRPIAEIRLAAGRQFWVTVPGEAVTADFAVTPREFGSPEDPTRPARSVSLVDTRTRGWYVVHLASGTTVAAVRFLEWARECASRLSEVEGADWSRVEQARPGVGARAAEICDEYLRREFDIADWSRGADVTSRRRARRELRRLGVQFHRPSAPT
jgi:hypothetical protein